MHNNIYLFHKMQLLKVYLEISAKLSGKAVRLLLLMEKVSSKLNLDIESGTKVIRFCLSPISDCIYFNWQLLVS